MWSRHYISVHQSTDQLGESYSQYLSEVQQLTSAKDGKFWGVDEKFHEGEEIQFGEVQGRIAELLVGVFRGSI
jgi:hypothetical protein